MGPLIVLTLLIVLAVPSFGWLYLKLKAVTEEVTALRGALATSQSAERRLTGATTTLRADLDAVTTDTRRAQTSLTALAGNVTRLEDWATATAPALGAQAKTLKALKSTAATTETQLATLTKAARSSIPAELHTTDPDVAPVLSDVFYRLAEAAGLTIVSQTTDPDRPLHTHYALSGRAPAPLTTWLSDAITAKPPELAALVAALSTADSAHLTLGPLHLTSTQGEVTYTLTR
ncbi:hypothetical protein GCM10027589_59070 [Actinocorallia lasiicapitis]